jgi:hypothetical protein
MRNMTGEVAARLGLEQRRTLSIQPVLEDDFDASPSGCPDTEVDTAARHQLGPNRQASIPGVASPGTISFG